MEQAATPPKPKVSRKTVLYGTVLVAMALAWLYLAITERQMPEGKVVIGEDIFVHVDIATTPAERSQGLSGRPSLGENEGMLFVFGVPGKYQFWMKDMLFPLDLIWIREGEIVDMTVDVPPPGPDGELPVYAPFEAADMVLEVRAGFAAAHGLRVGLPVAVAVDR